MLSKKANIVIIQELFIDNHEIFHIWLHFYGPQREWKNIRVMIAIKKERIDEIVIDYRKNLINNLYFIPLEIQIRDL